MLPKLLGFEVIPGGWKMVVMQFIRSRSKPRRVHDDEITRNTSLQARAARALRRRGAKLI